MVLILGKQCSWKSGVEYIYKSWQRMILHNSFDPSVLSSPTFFNVYQYFYLFITLTEVKFT